MINIIMRVAWVERGTLRVKCLAQEHNTMSPARARSEDERSNHEATVTSSDMISIISIHEIKQQTKDLSLKLS